MIIDCHGHRTRAPVRSTLRPNFWTSTTTTAPVGSGDGSGSGNGRTHILAGRAAVGVASRRAAAGVPTTSDDQLPESIEGSQPRHIAERGVDLTTVSPPASAMGHRLGDLASRIDSRHIPVSIRTVGGRPECRTRHPSRPRRSPDPPPSSTRRVAATGSDLPIGEDGEVLTRGVASRSIPRPQQRCRGSGMHGAASCVYIGQFGVWRVTFRAGKCRTPWIACDA